ncbi:hypothetical protein MRB53_013181 [Persea americana]|uniref:Uncharacterized protein n=1 Tax=Persea americana TaxID=3435 RepID=A0ACC2K7C4_PERAE|nr:hypothetical protein MRB53_013181 [Persea americana]
MKANAANNEGNTALDTLEQIPARDSDANVANDSNCRRMTIIKQLKARKRANPASLTDMQMKLIAVVGLIVTVTFQALATDRAKIRRSDRIIKGPIALERNRRVTDRAIEEDRFTTALDWTSLEILHAGNKGGAMLLRAAIAAEIRLLQIQAAIWIGFFPVGPVSPSPESLPHPVAGEGGSPPLPSVIVRVVAAASHPSGRRTQFYYRNRTVEEEEGGPAAGQGAKLDVGRWFLKLKYPIYVVVVYAEPFRLDPTVEFQNSCRLHFVAAAFEDKLMIPIFDADSHIMMACRSLFLSFLPLADGGGRGAFG